MGRYKCLGFCGCLGISYVAHAGELNSTSDATSKVSQLSYDLDAALLFSDRFSGMSRPAMAGKNETSVAPAETTTEASNGYRTLGLRHMKLGLEWLTPRRLRATVSLRPDAVSNSGKTKREVDTRSGVKLGSQPDIQLLDLYEMTLLRTDTEFAIGVRDFVLSESKAYKDVLEFGWEARFPRKVFGAFLDMQEIVKWSDESSLTAQVSAIGDSSDRHTDRSTNSETGDEAPARSSAYWGAAVAMTATFYRDTKLNLGSSLTESIVSDSKVIHSFYAVGALRVLDIAGARSTIGLDARQSKDAYKSSAVNLADTSSTSAAVTATSEIIKDRVALLAVRVGSGTRQSSADTSQALTGRGMQVETGLRAWLGDGLAGTALMTREWCRSQVEGGGQSGCFGTSGQHNIAVSRLAIQVSYNTGSSL